MLALAAASAAEARQARQPVEFSISYSQTTVGQSVFVLGDIAELGAGDLRKAVKLEPSQWPLWKATVSLPAGTSYTYRYYRRDDGPGRLGDSANGVLISGPFNAGTSSDAGAPAGKAVMLRTTLVSPVVNWRIAASGGAFAQMPMVDAGPGRTATERKWLAVGIGAGGRAVEMYFTGGGGAGRDPASGTYTTSLDGFLVQDGQVFSYVPAGAVTDWRRDYNAAALPAIQSQFLFENGQREWREYRVILPRGYDQNASKRYPVVYLHDGQNVFEFGPFGTWNAHTTAGDLVRRGQMREVILVGVDNGPNRISDYSAPDAGGNAGNYVRFLREELMPLINSQYRTLTGPDDTGAIGSSMGGQVSLYMGWDYAATFRRIGAFSGAWSVYTSGFYNRVMNEPKRAIRLYIDSGDAGTSNDNYWPTFNLRDDLLSRTGGADGPKFVLEGDLKHVIGLGQQHNEAAWAARLPDAYRFLFPATEEPGNPLLPLASGAAFDVNGDGRADIEDLYAIESAGGDLNLDGATDTEDGRVLEWYLRRDELRGMSPGR